MKQVLEVKLLVENQDKEGETPIFGLCDYQSLGGPINGNHRTSLLYFLTNDASNQIICCNF